MFPHARELRPRRFWAFWTWVLHQNYYRLIIRGNKTQGVVSKPLDKRQVFGFKQHGGGFLLLCNLAHFKGDIPADYFYIAFKVEPKASLIPVGRACKNPNVVCKHEFTVVKRSGRKIYLYSFFD